MNCPKCGNTVFSQASHRPGYRRVYCPKCEHEFFIKSEVMGEWWIYEDFPWSRVRVHRGECSFCKHGEGIHPNKEEGLNMKWWGPYSTRDEAWKVAVNLGRNDTDFCEFCRK